MPIRSRSLRPVVELVDDDNDTDDEDPCLVCALIEEHQDETNLRDEGAEEESLREKLATSLAYGMLVLGEGGDVRICDPCNKAIKLALADVRKELADFKAARRAARRAERRGRG
jgi:hypothetical protein